MDGSQQPKPITMSGLRNDLDSVMECNRHIYAVVSTLKEIVKTMSKDDQEKERIQNLIEEIEGELSLIKKLL